MPPEPARRRPRSRVAVHAAGLASIRARSFTSSRRSTCCCRGWQVACHVSVWLRWPATTSRSEFAGRRGFVRARRGRGKLHAFAQRLLSIARMRSSGRAWLTCSKFLTCMYPRLDLSPRRPQPQRERSRCVPGVRSLEVRTRRSSSKSSRASCSATGFARAGGASVAERMQPHAAELAHRTGSGPGAARRPLDAGPRDRSGRTSSRTTSRTSIPIGHPGLPALMEAKYDREVVHPGRARSTQSPRMREGPRSSGARQPHSCRSSSTCPSTCESAMDVFRAVPERVLRHLPPAWLDSSTSCRPVHGRVRNPRRAQFWLSGRPPRDARCCALAPRTSHARVQARRDEVLTDARCSRDSSRAPTRAASSRQGSRVLAGFQDWIRARLPVSRLTPGAGAPGTMLSARNATR